MYMGRSVTIRLNDKIIAALKDLAELEGKGRTYNNFVTSATIAFLVRCGYSEEELMKSENNIMGLNKIYLID